MYSMLTLWFVLFFAAGTAPALIQEVADSGRVVEIAVPPSERVTPQIQIPPGAPPILAFRLFEGRERNRFMNLDLVIDDAGH